MYHWSKGSPKVIGGKDVLLYNECECGRFYHVLGTPLHTRDPNEYCEKCNPCQENF